ncbi:Mitochondrial carrier protein, putative [Angomonas deanei]|uniref:Mitochondrial carrier protein, putative n=1 Tax=Angomonas deanei TaxID=59799 RepID=A0A7G2CQK6_9TRYP|nr:Mitochondrial carrier protein, putative [Angomonas deanei]
MSLSTSTAASSSSSTSSSPPPVSSSSSYADSFTRVLYDLVYALLPGAAQGCTTILAGHPLDTAKVRMQAAGPNAQYSPFKTMYQMTMREGLISLYRGVVPPLLMEGTKRSLQFALYDTFRACKREDRSSEKKERSLRATVVHCCAVIGSNPFLSGAVAGGLGTIIGCPMHVIKIQTQYQTREGTRNALTCTVQILHNDGIRGLYRGLKYNLLKDICFAAAYLGLFSVFKDYLRQPTGAEERGVLSPNSTAFISGATASMITWTIFYPLDTLKTLVQSRQTLDFSKFRHSPRLLYKGLSASLLKAGPVSGLSMVAYDFTKRKLTARREKRMEELIMLQP